MSGWLLDTNVLSELRRPRPEPRVVEFIRGQPLERLFVSEVTFAEIRFGIELQADTAWRAELQDWLAQRLRPMFRGRTLSVSEDVMFKWELLVEQGRKIGQTFSQPDLIIAATALQHDLTVVTRNAADFLRAATPVFNPWKDQAG